MMDGDVAHWWDRNAEVWARHVRAGYDVYRNLYNNPAFFDFVGEISGKTVLDAGCGEGYNTRLLARQGARMTGVDLSEKMIAFARSEEERNPLGIRYEVASMSDLSVFPDESIDAVVSTMALMDCAGYEEAISEFWRVLRSDGLLAFNICHPCFTYSIRDWDYAESGEVRGVRLGCGYFEETVETERWWFGAAPLILADPYIYDRSGGLVPHAPALKANQKILKKNLAYAKSRKIPLMYMGGLDPAVKGADPEFCGRNAAMSAFATDGYWVFYEGPTYDKDHVDYFRWFTRANRAIVASDRSWHTWARVDLAAGFHDPERFGHLVLSGTPEMIGKLSDEFRKGGRTGPIVVFSPEGFARTTYMKLAADAFLQGENMLAQLRDESQREKSPATAAEIKRRLETYAAQLAQLKADASGPMDAAKWNRLNIAVQECLKRVGKVIAETRLQALLDNI